MVDPYQFQMNIIRPTLQDMNMWSEAAEILLLGTALVESNLCYLVQHNGGPARSFYQIEPITAMDIVQRYFEQRPDLEKRFEQTYQVIDSHEIDWAKVDVNKISLKLVSDMRFSTAIARLKYWMIEDPLPKASDIQGLATYWKKYYNTPDGAGFVTDFVNNLRQLKLRY